VYKAAGMVYYNYIERKPTMTNFITAIYAKLDNHGKRMAWIAGACVVITTPVAIGSAIYEAGYQASLANAPAVVPAAPVPVAPVVVAEAPAPTPVVEAPPVAPTYEFTYEGAKTEICEAAHQYRGDVTAGYMDTKGARYELSSYAKYLAKNSPAGGMELLTVGKACYGF